MTSIIAAFHDILYYKTAPSASSIGVVLLVGIVLVLLGEFVFARLEGNFAEEL